MDILFLIGRIVYGGFFIMMGANHFMKGAMMTGYAASKGILAPKVSVYVSGLFIVFGGLGILLGVYVELAVALLVIFLTVVSIKMHNFWTIQDPQAKMGEMTNFLKNMALAGAALMTLLLPPNWPFSLPL